VAELYYYLAPLIIPILPREAGATVILIDLANLLSDIAADDGRAVLTFEVQVFEGGRKVGEEKFSVDADAKKPDLPRFERRYVGNALGYTEITVTSDRPYFRKLLTEHAHTFIERPDGGTFNVTTMMKFSDPAMIDLMRRIGQFCLVHSGQYVSKQRNIGNSTLIANPFDGPIVARLTSGKGKELRRRIGPKDVALIGLDQLIDDDEWSCVLFTGSNRYPAWDVRHAYDDPNRINRMDHLEYYRGDLTMRPMSLPAMLRSRARRTLQALGLRN
jgi:hypothetical protein